MKVRTCISSVGIATIAATAILPTAIQPGMAQESTLALCEASRNTVRIYRSDGQTLMRVFDRINNQVWLNNTPTRVQANAETTEYVNLRGETLVRVLANRNSNNCSIQVGNQSIDNGRLGSTTPPPTATVPSRADALESCRIRLGQEGLGLTAVGADTATSSYRQLELTVRRSGSNSTFPVRCRRYTNGTTTLVDFQQLADPVEAERACQARAASLGYQITNASLAQLVTGGFSVALRASSNGQDIALTCTYNTQTRQAEIER